LAHLQSEGVLAGTIAPRTVRLVTHHDVDDAGWSAPWPPWPAHPTEAASKEDGR
jgi:hypothetical protein